MLGASVVKPSLNSGAGVAVVTLKATGGVVATVLPTGKVVELFTMFVGGVDVTFLPEVDPGVGEGTGVIPGTGVGGAVDAAGDVVLNSVVGTTVVVALNPVVLFEAST